MYFAIICFIYLIINIKKLNNKIVIKKIIVSLLFIIIITSFFWSPLLEHKISADYEVFKEGRMERTDVLIALKLNFSELFITQNSSIMIFEIGLISTLILIFTPLVIKKIKQKYKKTDFYNLYIFSLITGIVCIFMTLKIFPFEYLPSILKMLQFSFRLLEFSTFFFAFVVAINIEKLIKNIKYKDIIIIMILLILLFTLYISHLHYADNLDENKLWPAVPVTSDTGRVHAGCASFEYLPSKAFENRSYIETREDKIIILEGDAKILEENKENTNLNAKISSSVENVKLELPYIYYLGYEVTLKQNGEIVKLETYETENGFIGITIPNVTQEGLLEVNYQGTAIMKISAFTSILGAILLLVTIILRLYIDNCK